MTTNSPIKNNRYNPNAIRRCVRRTGNTQGRVEFVTKSFRNNDNQWKPIVDTQTGMVSCNCPDFEYRHKAHTPNVHTTAHHCKHIKRAIANCQRHGEITPDLKPASVAGVAVVVAVIFTEDDLNDIIDS